MQAGGTERCGEKLRASIQLHCREEKRDAKLSECEVGIDRHVPDLPTDTTDTSQHPHKAEILLP